MFNKIILVGNLTRDIEIRYTQAGMTIAKSAIATSRKFKSNTGEQKEEVCFVDITFLVEVQKWQISICIRVPRY